jgi:hypothetical protein
MARTMAVMVAIAEATSLNFPQIRFLSRNLAVERTLVKGRLVQKRFHIHSRKYRNDCVARLFSRLEGDIGKVVNANRLPRRVRVKGAAVCACA